MSEPANSVTRRDFLKTTAATATGALAVAKTAAAPAAAPLVNARVIGANDRVHMAIIGVKGMGGGHLRNLAGEQMQGDNVDVVSVCDVWDLARRKAQTTARLGDAAVVSDYRRVLDNKDVDAVVVATPDHWHGRMGLEALEAGKHLYIEKPFTRYLDEAFRIHDAAKRTKLRVQVGSQGCSDSKIQRARALVQSGDVGKVLWAQGSYCRNNQRGEWNYKIEPEATVQTVDWKTWLGPARSRPFSPERFFRWRKFWDYGTGIIGDLWPHRLHPLMLAMDLGEFPASVSCMGGDLCATDRSAGPDGQPNGEVREVADTTLMMVNFPSGAMIVLAGSTVNERGLEDVIRGSKSNLTMGGGRLEIIPERPFTDELDARDETPEDAGESHLKHMRNFLHAIRTNTPASCNEDLAIRVQAVVSMAEEAYRKGRLVRFDERARTLLS